MQKTLSVTSSLILEKQLNELKLALGENRTRVIVRAVAEAHAKYVNQHTHTAHLTDSERRERGKTITTSDPTDCD